MPAAIIESIMVAQVIDSMVRRSDT
jgi:hypothetical protein